MTADLIDARQRVQDDRFPGQDVHYMLVDDVLAPRLFIVLRPILRVQSSASSNAAAQLVLSLSGLK